mgnify:CR=1 FL=1
MSKYTTEVRFICESKSGLEESKGCDNVDVVLNNSWSKIFTSTCEFFDEEYRAVLCKKILKHYYLREICSETVGIWKLWMNTKLEEIMPYYNQLYKSALLKFEPLVDVDVKRTHKRTNVEDSTDNRTSSSKTSSTSSDTSHSENSDTSRDLFSDTPQGALDGVESEKYLTNARKITDGGSVDSSGSGKSDVSYSDTEGKTGNVNSTEDFVESVTGKQGSGTFSKMLMEFRDTLINIDMTVIDEFEDLFFGLW